MGEEVAGVRASQEIEDEEHEQLVERVDVAKAPGMVCTRVPHPSRPGRRRTRVWDVDATTNAIIELGGQLAAEGIEKVTIESTSDYWRPFFLPAGSGRPGGAAGQRPRREERPGPPENGRHQSCPCRGSGVAAPAAIIAPRP
jgi:hypothetical protein